MSTAHQRPLAQNPALTTPSPRCRTQQEAVVSFKPFIESQNPKLFELFGVPEMREQLVRPNFKAFYEEVRGHHR